MKFKFYDKEFLSKMDKQKKQYLLALGEVGKNQAASITPVRTGASKNAKNYRITKVNQVQIFAPLDYDRFLERRFAILKLTLEYISNVAELLAKKVFRV